jgi:hypothetical protein
MAISFNISSSGVAYLFLFISLAFLAYRFFQYWQRTKDVISGAFFYSAFLFDIFAFSKAIAGLFFATNYEILSSTVVLGSALQGLSAVIGFFILIHLKFPRRSPWLGCSLIFILAIISTGFTWSSISQRLITFGTFGAINWGTASMGLTLSLIRIAILVLAFFPAIFVLFQQGMAAKEPSLKKRAYGFAAALSLGIIIGVLDYFFIELLKVDAISRDIAMIILSILLFFVVFFTQKSSTAEKK